MLIIRGKTNTARRSPRRWMLGACLRRLRGCRCGNWNFLIISLCLPLVSWKEKYSYDYGNDNNYNNDDDKNNNHYYNIRITITISDDNDDKWESLYIWTCLQMYSKNAPLSVSLKSFVYPSQNTSIIYQQCNDQYNCQASKLLLY